MEKKTNHIEFTSLSFKGKVSDEIKIALSDADIIRQGDVFEKYDCIYVNLSKNLSGVILSNHYIYTNINKQDKYTPLSESEMLDNIKLFKGESTFSEEKPSDTTEGVKYSQNKAPMGVILKQFPLALQSVAYRSKYGHEKYLEYDHDWMNFKREPNTAEGYKDAAVRHLAEIGDDEDSIGHLEAAAWNILATLQLTLEKND